MSSSRSRYSHIQPSSPMDMMMASTEAGMASMRNKINQIKEDERTTQGRCTYCGKEGGDALKSCSRCKAARYCDQKCQLADFKSRHKRECANFLSPPTTSAFLTKPVANERFPQHPVFAHWHEDGVGCWVSISGRIDCDLESFTSPVSPHGQSYSARQEQIASGPDHGRMMIRTHKAAANSLLGLRVLVQNRRKDKERILVFGSQIQAVAFPSLKSAVLGGTAQGDNIAKFTKDRVSYVAVGVANDPWDKVPRLEITHFNGQEVKQPHPAGIKDATSGIVALGQGEHVIYHLQLRVGDGDTIAKDWEAFRCLEALHIPYALWDGTSPPSALLPSLPLAHTQPAPASAATTRSLRAPFDQRAVSAHYADFIERGEEAYMRSHYGDARADMARSADSMMEMMGEMLLSTVAQAGNTHVLAQRLRDMGMGDLADKVAARGP